MAARIFALQPVCGMNNGPRSLIETNRWAWSRRRKDVMRRDGYRCRIGGPSCLIFAEEVDHIIPRIAGGSDHMDNLRAVCKPCHKSRIVDALRGVPESAPRPAGRSIFHVRPKVM